MVKQLLEAEADSTQAIRNECEVNYEVFRSNAADAFRQYSVGDRAVIRSLESKTNAAYTFLADALATFFPMMLSIQRAQSQQAVVRTLKKYMQYSDVEAEHAAEELVDKRVSELMHAFAMRHYSDSRRAQCVALKVLSQSQSSVSELFTHYTQATIYCSVAKESHVATLDSNRGYFARHRMRRAISRQQRAAITTENIRKRAIISSLSTLENDHNGLIKRIMSHEVDLITIVALRNEYEKQLKKADNVSSTERLALFDSVTRTFRETYVEERSAADGHASLSSLKKLANDISDLVTEIFDLSVTEKNALVVSMGQYRELRTELDTIAAFQVTRDRLSI